MSNVDIAHVAKVGSNPAVEYLGDAVQAAVNLRTAHVILPLDVAHVLASMLCKRPSPSGEGFIWEGVNGIQAPCFSTGVIINYDAVVEFALHGVALLNKQMRHNFPPPPLESPPVEVTSVSFEEEQRRTRPLRRQIPLQAAHMG